MVNDHALSIGIRGKYFPDQVPFNASQRSLKRNDKDFCNLFVF